MYEITSSTKFRVYESSGEWFYEPREWTGDDHFSEPCESEAEAREMIAAELASVAEAS